MAKRFSLISLGCAKNLVDSEMMIQILENGSYVFEDDPEKADILIVNTCGFIESAQRESVDAILDLCRYKGEGDPKLLVVTGCLAQRYAEDLKKEIPEIDALVGTASFGSIADIIDQALEGKTVVATEPLDWFPETVPGLVPRTYLTPPHTSYVKIAEGCNNHCSYCIIPKLRGPLRSRSVDSIHEEVLNKTKGGAKEIILVAQDLTQFGKDRREPGGLEKLLQSLTKIPNLNWLRLLYTYPHSISTELLAVIADNPVICQYLDIPMQHCSDDILLRMNRRDRKSDMIHLVEKIRKTIPDIALRSTFIVGFPGETEKDFTELLDFLQVVRLDRAGFFRYSQEDGTPAALMADQLADEVKEERYQRAVNCQEEIAFGINQNFIGRKMKILIEEITGNSLYPYLGRSYRDAPEIDGQVYLQGDGATIGTFVEAVIEQVDTFDFFGIIIDPSQEREES